MQTTGCISGSTTPDGVTLEGSTGTPGTGSGGGGSGSGSVDSSVDAGAAADEPCEQVYRDYCYGVGPGRAPEAPTATPTVTLADVAQFRPQSATQSMEPEGWMVVGLEANFFASSGIHQVDGTLLGQPASVRFTPVAFHWDYGDGTTRTSAVGGASWGDLGAREFDATPTSHAYSAPGTYTITLAIDYAAQYRFGAGAWMPVPGVVRVQANQLNAVAGDAKTVLVERQCTVDPSGPGC
ncbi:MAG TPA: hypothetical protein VN200_08695 [Rhodoglobus sp.]|nr:hypothetical protein [Rhodoglobus sp.]